MRLAALPGEAPPIGCYAMTAGNFVLFQAERPATFDAEARAEMLAHADPGGEPVATRKQKLSTRALCEVVREMQAGLVEADLGGGRLKKRIARPAAHATGFRVPDRGSVNPAPSGDGSRCLSCVQSSLPLPPGEVGAKTPGEGKVGT